VSTRICELTEDASVRLNYSSLISVAYLQLEDTEKSSQILEKAVSLYDGLKGEERSGYGDFQCAHSMQLLGQLKEDDAAINSAISRFRALIGNADETRYKKDFLADCMRSIGKCYLLLDDPETAITSLKQSLELWSSNWACILLAEAQLSSNNYDACRSALSEVSTTELSEENFYDYAMTLANLALKLATVKDIEEAKVILKENKCRTPYFQRQHDRTLIDLLEAQNQLLTQHDKVE